jgi:hypothetical protein
VAKDGGDPGSFEPGGDTIRLRDSFCWNEFSLGHLLTKERTGCQRLPVGEATLGERTHD